MSTFENLVEEHNEGKYASSLLLVKKYQMKMMQDLGFSIPRNERWILNCHDFDEFDKKILGDEEDSETHVPDELISEFETSVISSDSDFESKQRLRISNIYEKNDEKIAVIYLPVDENGNTVSSTMNAFTSFVGVNIVDENEGGSSKKKTKKKKKEKVEDSFFSNDVKQYILVTKNPIKGASSKPLQKLVEHPDLEIFLFQDIDFRYNPLDGCFVGTIKTFSPSEKSSFLKNNEIKNQRFPTIFSNDPMAKRFLLSPGDLVSFDIELPDTLICSEKIEIRTVVTSKLEKIKQM